MHWSNLLACSILASAAVVISQDPKAKKAPEAPPKPKLAQLDAFAYDGSSITALPVKDMKAAQAWYTKVIGASMFYELEEQGWCELTSPVANALIGLSANDAAQPSKDSTLSFGVKDMAKAKAWLQKNEVKLQGDVVTIPQTVKLLYFFDPDGNRLMFYEPYQAN